MEKGDIIMTIKYLIAFTKRLLKDEHGIIPALIAGGAALAAGGILGKRKSVSAPDYTPLIDQINQSAAKQRDIVTNEQPQLAAAGTKYQTDINKAVDTSQNQARQSSAQFLQDIGKSTQFQGQQLSDILAQRVLGQQPELQKQLRENMAATGGLQRGAAVKGSQALAQNAVGQIAQGNQQIALQQQAALNQAKGQAQQLDQQLISDKLGIDKDTLLKLYDTGRTDLINEANSLLGIEQNTSQAIENVTGAQIGANTASQVSAAQQRDALLNSLTGMGTGMMSLGAGALGGGGGSPTGSTLDNPTISNLNTNAWNDYLKNRMQPTAMQTDYGMMGAQ